MKAWIERVNARLEHFAEEDRRTQADDTDLDVKFALDRRFQPCSGTRKKLLIDQAEDHRKENRLEVPDRLIAGIECHGLRQPEPRAKMASSETAKIRLAADGPISAMTDTRQNQQEERTSLRRSIQFAGGGQRLWASQAFQRGNSRASRRIAAPAPTITQSSLLSCRIKLFFINYTLTSVQRSDFFAGIRYA